MIRSIIMMSEDTFRQENRKFVNISINSTGKITFEQLSQWI
jgi:hypothetical protein